jgi:hypothetical protein
MQIPDCGLLCDLLWSDPDKDITGWSENDRGVSFTFGPDVVSRFLQKHDMDLICRAHQVVEDGYEFFSKRQLVTLFSAPNYCGEFDNAGAMMSVDESLLCSFQVCQSTLHVRAMLTILADFETCREETKVRPQVWRQQTHVSWQQKALEQSIPHPSFQNAYELLSTAGLGVVRRWHIAKPSTNRIPNQLCDLEPPLPLYRSQSSTRTPIDMCTQNSPLVFCFANSAARPTDDHDDRAHCLPYSASQHGRMR